jgi:pimeloyl-ACP methyl ester carboxylesterase
MLRAQDAQEQSGGLSQGRGKDRRHVEVTLMRQVGGESEQGMGMAVSNSTRRDQLVSAVALFLIGTGVFAAEPIDPSACRDRGALPDTPVEQSRLPELTYECASLRGGRVLIGRAGPAVGETVLLVHGLGDNAHRDWRQVIPELATQYKVIALDLPGFGASDTGPRGYSFEMLATTLAEVLDRDAVQRAHVVGHSLGGAISLYFAHTYPQRTNKLVLVDAAGILLKSVYVHHVSKVSIPEIGFSPLDRLIDRIDNRINGVSRHILFQLENRFDFSTWLADNPAVRVPLLGRFTQTDAALGLIEHDFTRAIRETKAPTTIFWGRNDDISPVRVGKLLEGRMPNARLHVIERTGHVPMYESVREFTSLLMQALRQPLEPKQTPAMAIELRSVECRDQTNQVYTGRFTTVSLQSCRDARIENAHIENLIVKDSSVTLETVTINSSDVAIAAVDSFVTATVVSVSGRIAITADNSQLDLAGASIRARERAIEMPGSSRVYFSVSDIESPKTTRDLHEIWDERNEPLP